VSLLALGADVQNVINALDVVAFANVLDASRFVECKVIVTEVLYQFLVDLFFG
jgi:hypothetical protein